MRKRAVGAIYNYPGKYTGSVQDGDILRRHKQHIKHNKPFGRWLRENIDVKPVLVCRVVQQPGESRKKWIIRLYSREAYFIQKLNTLKRYGGFNQIVSFAIDYREIARIAANTLVDDGFGNFIRACDKAASLANIEKDPKTGKSINAMRGGKLGSNTLVDDGHGNLIRACDKAGRESNRWRAKNPKAVREYVENSHRTNKKNRSSVWNPKIQKQGSLAGRPFANHTRWHVNRGIVNPKCKTCMKGKK